jgi:thioredoxin reductase (NADPH)
VGEGSMSEKVVYANMENFEQQVLKSELPVALNFCSDTCPYCDALLPKFERIAEQYSTQIKFAKISTTQNKDISEKYCVKCTPTVMFFQKGKEIRSRLIGNITSSKLERVIKNLIGETLDKDGFKKVKCDVLIVGGGPAGLSAAIYTARARLNTVVIEEGVVGGQVVRTHHIANYPGTSGNISGKDLIENMRRQAESFGAKIETSKEILEVKLKGNEKTIKIEDIEYCTRAVIIATGAEPRKLQAKGEGEYRGRGIHYCAACDGAMYQDSRNIVVVGGGNSALQEAIFLTRFAKHITIIHQFDYFQASRIMQEEVLNNNLIEVIWNSEVREVKGDGCEKSITIKNVKTKEISDITCESVFVYIGMQPRAEFLKKQVKMKKDGSIITDNDMRTSLKGVFAAGDVRKKSVRQIATAVGDGVVAAMSAEIYLTQNKATLIPDPSPDLG